MNNHLSSNSYKSGRYIGAILVGALALLSVFLFWAEHLQSNRNNFKRQLDAYGDYITSELKSSFVSDIAALRNLGERIEVTDGDYFDHWTWDAARIIEQHPSFKFIEWIDSSMVIRKVEPSIGNEKVIGLNIATLGYRHRDWQQAVLDSNINLTAWVDLQQGGQAFLIDDPLHYRGAQKGTITAGLDFTASIDDMVGGMTSYFISIRDEDGRIFYQKGHDSLEVVDYPDFRYRADIDLPYQNTRWTFEMIPTRAHYREEVLWNNGVGLILGVILSILLGVVTYLAQSASRENRQEKKVNKRLQQLNFELEAERARAEKASNSKTEFLSNMSHEIRTPLNALIGFIGLLQERLKEEEDRRYLSMMDFSSKSLLSLVNDILEIDKIESGKLSLSLQPFVPSREIEELISFFMPGFDERKLKLHLEMQSSGETVLGDVAKFNQIFTNIIRNAFKFTLEGGVQIGYREVVKDDMVDIVVEISDSGIGIPQDKIESIFERFSQVDSSTKRRYEGTGLGLAITYQLVQAMEGDISVISDEGKGSCFTVNLSLPRREPQALSAATTSSQPTKSDFGSHKVLIVEDNAMNVVVLSKVLEQFGLISDIAETGKQALSMTAEKDYDLVFMDVHMPGMDGFETTQRLRERGLNVPIIGLSANVTRDAIEESKQAGMQDYVTKPFTRDRLLDVLKLHLRSYSHQ